jgi:hypothetical protein
MENLNADLSDYFPTSNNARGVKTHSLEKWSLSISTLFEVISQVAHQ